MFPEMNGTLIGGNLMELFIYANSVTHEMFGLFIVIAFFLVTFIGSMFAQMSMANRDPNPKTSLLASSFATLGWATILEMYSGILNPVYFFVLIGINILAIIWVATGD